MILKRLTNDHPTAVFLPDRSRDYDMAYHREVQKALLVLCPRGWRNGGAVFLNPIVGRRKQYVVEHSITYSQRGKYGDSADMIVELKEPVRVIDFNEIIDLA